MTRAPLPDNHENPPSSASTASLVRLSRLRQRAITALRVSSRVPSWVVFLAGLGVVLLVAVADYLTVPLASFSLFYLFPVVATSWLLGRARGNALALLAALAWGLADRLGPFAEPWSPIPYWNDVMLLAVFLLVVYLVGALRAITDFDNDLLAEVQARLLPAELPRVEGCEIAGEWRPAGVVGGDYYDVVPLGGSSVALCIADVSGKGLPAALVMSNVQAGLRALLGDGAGPAEVLRRLNALLTANVRRGTFVTLFLGVLDPAAGRLAFSNAGHNPPILLHGDGSWQRLSEGGPVLGVLPDAAYRADQVAVAPGDRLVLYTDAVTERATADGEEFGEQRLVATLQANRDRSAAALRDAVIAAGEAFGSGPFEDDLTLLVAALTPARTIAAA